MRRNVSVFFSFLGIVGFLAIGCSAGTKWQKQEQKKADKLICYQCNSLYDSRCGDPFDPYTLGHVDCNLRTPPSHLNSTLKPILCRKTVQKVQGKTRVIRGCGYIPETRTNQTCVKRTGTHEVHVTYCTCNTSFCNFAYQSLPSTTLLTFATAVLPIVHFFYIDD